MYAAAATILCIGIGLSLLPPISSFVVHSKYAQRFQNVLASRDPDNIHFRPWKDDDESYCDPRLIEFQLGDAMNDSEVRALRKQRERSQQQTFASFGNDLWHIRKRILDLSNQLVSAVAAKEDTTEIRDEILKMEQQDAEAVYFMELDKMYNAINEGRDEDAKTHSERAVFARGTLPQYNLEGECHYFWFGDCYPSYSFIPFTIPRFMGWKVWRWISNDKYHLHR